MESSAAQFYDKFLFIVGSEDTNIFGRFRRSIFRKVKVFCEYMIFFVIKEVVVRNERIQGVYAIGVGTFKNKEKISGTSEFHQLPENGQIQCEGMTVVSGKWEFSEIKCSAVHCKEANRSIRFTGKISESQSHFQRRM